MKQFVIDQLTLKHTMDHLYDLTAVCNINKSGTNAITGTLQSTDRELIFDVTDPGIKDTEALKISMTGIDFSSYRKRDMLFIVFSDKTGGVDLRSENAAFGIRDTEYPPPYLKPKPFIPQDSLTSFFTIEKLFINRVAGTGPNFTINIDLSYSHPTIKFTPNIARIEPDTTRGDMQVVVMYVDADMDGNQHSEKISFAITTAAPVRLGDPDFVSRGLSFVITDQIVGSPAAMDGLLKKKALGFVI